MYVVIKCFLKSRRHLHGELQVDGPGEHGGHGLEVRGVGAQPLAEGGGGVGEDVCGWQVRGGDVGELGEPGCGAAAGGPRTWGGLH